MKNIKVIVVFVLFAGLAVSYNNCGQVKFANQSGHDNSTNLPPSGVVGLNDLSQPNTLAFNDNYPSAGDADYNDFVTNIVVTESYNVASGQLQKITIQYTPIYKISGGDHQFVLIFDGTVRGRNGFVSNLINTPSTPMFSGAVNIDYELTVNGQTLSSDPKHDQTTDLILFPSTTQAMAQRQVATVTITGFDGTNTFAVRGSPSILRYRSILSVASSSTRYDIDISDIDPKFVDASGTPCGFFVPTNWRPPGESMDIHNIYPDFGAHALYLQSGAPLNAEPSTTAQWYNNLAPNAASELAPLP